MTATSFFVYGSMSEGMVHFERIAQFIERSAPASIKATAYRLKVGFPALVKGGEQAVDGQLIQLKSSDLLVNLLDEFFGYNKLDVDKSLYRREEVFAELLGSQELVPAWCYFLNPKKIPAGATIIEDGNWRQSLAQNPALTEKLTERQKSYILRLGAATGRDIVPINDMTLYRELMNLELIVDKGRRLALSKFGQEVYRHLG